MSVTSEGLERQLINDIQTLGDMVTDESFYSELYRALANVQWHRSGEGGHVTLSWKRAEELINDARAQHDREPLTLAQTGGEGEVSDRVGEALAGLGWSPRPLDTGTRDDSHAESRSEAPPRDDGEPPEWERQAHAEADEERRRKFTR
jgi:hypothetical protein